LQFVVNNPAQGYVLSFIENHISISPGRTEPSILLNLKMFSLTPLFFFAFGLFLLILRFANYLLSQAAENE